MNKILIALFLCAAALFTATLSMAENWVHYGSSPLFEAYIDSETIQFSEYDASFWVKWVLNEKGKAEFAGKNKAKKKKLSYLKGRWAVTCVSKKHPFPPAAYEKSNYLFDVSGNILEQNTGLNESYEIMPGTLMQTMHSTVCKSIEMNNEEEAAKKAEEAEREIAEKAAKEVIERKNAEQTAGLQVDASDKTIKFNGKLIIEDKAASEIYPLKEYHDKDKAINVIRFDYKETSCPFMYMIITVDQDGVYQATEKFGNCTKPKTNRYQKEDKRIVFTFPGTPPQVWVYRDGQILKQ